MGKKEKKGKKNKHKIYLKKRGVDAIVARREKEIDKGDGEL